jgi:hypothetical protein
MTQRYIGGVSEIRQLKERDEEMLRRQWFAVAIVLAVLFTIPGVALAAGNGSENGNGTDQFGPYTLVTQDGGSCGGAWANETFDRTWKVHDNGDGTFLVSRQDKNGTFETLDGNSPGGCSTSEHHGTTLTAGIVGQMSGDLTFDVVSSSYDPTACESADCSTTTDFLAAVFPGFDSYCSSVCRWNFEYSSNDKALAYHHWQDRSDATGDDIFVGDIATQ